MSILLRYLLLSAFLFSSHLAIGQTQAQPDDGIITDAIPLTDGDSVKYFATQVVSITGPVVGTGKTEGKDGVISFINMFRAWPETPFSITIYRQHLPFFAPIEQFEGKKVRVTGKVRQYGDKETGALRYSISLRQPSQIEILD
ncbi:MAG: hypothetical protein KIS77_13630 [Saprospiraceae bacterium]|nr:hypothetical protein [Saprospiraceae bacterium]